MPTVAISGPQHLTCAECGVEWQRPQTRGLRPSRCLECRPRPVVRTAAQEILTCRRCGFSWERPVRQGPRPFNCRDCRRIVKAERQDARRRTHAGLRPLGEVERWRRTLANAGIPAERTEGEWVNHPTALLNLLRVIGGTSLHTINAERRRARKAVA